MLRKNVPATLLVCASLVFALGACGGEDDAVGPDESPADTTPPADTTGPVDTTPPADTTPAVETADVTYTCAMDGCDKTKSVAASGDPPSC